jgi:ubiquinone biosynthesis protein UbiJ
MLKYIKNSFLKKKLKNLKIKHNRLLKETESMNNHNHNSEDLFKKIHVIENRIEQLESKING